MASGSPERILVRGVNWLGDAVMSTPALQRLREARPEAHITLLTPEKLKDLWLDHQALDSVQAFAEGESVWSVGRRLRAGKFQIGLALPNSPRSALELWLGSIPRRIGVARPWRNWLLTQRIEPPANAAQMRKRPVNEINRLIAQNPPSPRTSYAAGDHHIYQYLRLTAALGGKLESLPPRLFVQGQLTEKFVARFKIGQSASGTFWLGLNAGAEYGPAKRWPEERFAEAAIEIQRRTRCGWLIFGVASEREACARLATTISRATEELFGGDEKQVLNLAGETSLRELLAALKFCRVLLTNDSGPMHVAAALGTPVVVPFGSTSPELTGPGLPGDTRHACLTANAPCSPCFLRVCPIDFRCMTGISVQRVVEAVVKAAG
jgi:heptosyltransferase-2